MGECGRFPGYIRRRVIPRRKSKAEHLYSALHDIQTTLKRSGMDHSGLPAINTIPATIPTCRGRCFCLV